MYFGWVRAGLLLGRAYFSATAAFNGALIVAEDSDLGYRIVRKMNQRNFSSEIDRLMDPYWRKARIGARLLLKRRAGKHWSFRDHRVAQRLVDDPGVTNRLLDQAMHSLEVRRKNGPGILGWFR